MGKTWENEVCSVLNHLKHLETSLKPPSIFEVRRNVQSQVVLSLKIFDVGKCHLKQFDTAISTFNPWAFDTAPAAWHFFSLTEARDVDVSSLLQAERELHSLLGPVLLGAGRCNVCFNMFQHSQQIRSQRSQKQNRRKKQGLSNQTAWFPGIFLTNLSDHNRAVHY
jgi:hypothetical protein